MGKEGEGEKLSESRDWRPSRQQQINTHTLDPTPSSAFTVGNCSYSLAEFTTFPGGREMCVCVFVCLENHLWLCCPSNYITSLLIVFSGTGDNHKKFRPALGRSEPSSLANPFRKPFPLAPCLLHLCCLATCQSPSLYMSLSVLLGVGIKVNFPLDVHLISI